MQAYIDYVFYVQFMTYIDDNSTDSPIETIWITKMSCIIASNIQGN